MAITITNGSMSIASGNDFIDWLATVIDVDSHDSTSTARSLTWGGVTLTASNNGVNVKRTSAGSTSFSFSIAASSMDYTLYKSGDSTLIDYVFSGDSTSSYSSAVLFDTCTNLASNQTGKIFAKGSAGNSSAGYSPYVISGEECDDYKSTPYLSSQCITQLYPLVQVCGNKADKSFGVLRSAYWNLRSLVTIAGEEFYVCRNMAIKG